MAEKKSFINYIAEVKTEYKYVLKFAVNEMTDLMIDQLESSLTKYDLKKASSFRKTPIQESPLDFPNIKNMPVFICDLTLGYPGSLDFLRTYICNNLGISPAQVAVYSENDPRQIETDLYIDRNSPEYRKNYKARLGSDYEQVDGAEEETYGEKYNTSFLKELEQVRKERKVVTVENPLSHAEDIDHSTLPDGYDGFNDPKNLKKDDVGLFGRIKRPNIFNTGVL
jgi:hypothetical protein